MKRGTRSQNRPPGARATISDVAARAGVSITAVSRALNRPRHETRIPEKTYEAILAAATLLNYQPSWSARALARGTTGNIGVLFTGWNPLLDPVFGELATTLSATLRRHHYRMLLIPIGNDPADEADWRTALEQRQVDACVVSHGLPEPVADCLTRQRIPAVLMNLDLDQPHPRIVADDADGIRQATQHLIDLGHRNIAYLYRPRPMGRPSVAIRREGFLQAMTAAGLAERASLHLYEASDFVDRWAADRSIATAVVCYSHAEAVDLYHALWKRGIVVPNDLSVIAFNDVYPTALMTPPLTVMAMPFAEIGRLAAERVLAMLQQPAEAPSAASEPSRVTLPLRLVQRQSTAPPNAGN
ncbi:MAG: LacI family DNA-binding transcriptional regulator [Tepidisphaeraceae bacterium]